MPHCPTLSPFTVPEQGKKAGESNPGAHRTPATRPASSHNRCMDRELTPDLLQASEAATGVALHHMLATLGTKAKNRHHDESQLRINGHPALGERTLCQGSTTSCHLPGLHQAPRRPQTAFTASPASAPAQPGKVCLHAQHRSTTSQPCMSCREARHRRKLRYQGKFLPLS